MRNIVLVCLDSVRKDYFDIYAPRLKNLSDTSFEQCRAASSWSVPSHASLLTGELPSDHDVHAYNIDYSQISPEETFLEGLPNHLKIGMSANSYVSPKFGFDRPFDQFHRIFDHYRKPDGIEPVTTEGEGNINYFKNSILHDHPIDSLLNGLFEKLDELSARLPVPKPFDNGTKVISQLALDELSTVEKPFFLFTNHMDAHLPFQATRGYDSNLYSAPASWSTSDIDQWEAIYDPPDNHHFWLRELYGASIEYLDRELTSFIRRLLEEHPNTTIVITADHGENLGYDHEDGLLRHRSSLSEGLLHVPLEIINPPSEFKYDDEKYFSHLEMGELITGIVNEVAPNVFPEQIAAELIGLFNCPDPPRDLEFWNRMIRSVYHDTSKTEWDSMGESNIYNLDPNRPCWQSIDQEGVDVERLESKWFNQTISEYREEARESTQDITIDKSTENRLKKLGYL